MILEYTRRGRDESDRRVVGDPHEFEVLAGPEGLFGSLITMSNVKYKTYRSAETFTRGNF